MPALWGKKTLCLIIIWVLKGRLSSGFHILTRVTSFYYTGEKKSIGCIEMKGGSEERTTLGHFSQICASIVGKRHYALLLFGS